MIKNGISANTTDRLLRNEQRHLKFDDIEKLCLGLNCSPSELFIWQPDSEADNIPNHPLQAIRSNKTLPDVMEELNRSTIDELKIIADFMAKLKEERGR
jgi:DNA-binding Xre family transcriptional regulator